MNIKRLAKSIGAALGLVLGFSLLMAGIVALAIWSGPFGFLIVLGSFVTVALSIRFYTDPTIFKKDST